MVGTVSLASVITLGGLGLGFNSGVVAVALPEIKKHWHMSNVIQGLFTASMLIGAAIGSLFGGYFTDKLGRKKAIITVSILETGGAVCVAFAPNLPLMMVARGVTGLGCGLSAVACPTYVSESAPPHLKGTLGTLFQLSLTFGIFVSYLVALPFDHMETGFQGFRIMFLLGVIPGVLLLLQSLVMPESPYWLSLQKKDPLLSKAEPSSNSQHKFGRDIIYPSTNKAYFVGMLLAVAQQLTGINAFMYYGPDIFASAGVKDAIAATIGIGAWNFVTTFVSTFLVDRLGRRPLLIWGTSAMTLSTIGLALVSQLVKTDSIKGPLSIVLLFIFIAGFEAGEGPLFWVVCTELFPPEEKGRALSVLNLAVWIFNLMLTFGFLPLKELIKQTGVFWVFGAFGVACVSLMLFYLPETKRVEAVVVEERVEITREEKRRSAYGAT